MLAFFLLTYHPTARPRLARRLQHGLRSLQGGRPARRSVAFHRAARYEYVAAGKRRARLSCAPSICCMSGVETATRVAAVPCTQAARVNVGRARGALRYPPCAIRLRVLDTIVACLWTTNRQTAIATLRDIGCDSKIPARACTNEEHTTPRYITLHSLQPRRNYLSQPLSHVSAQTNAVWRETTSTPYCTGKWPK